MDLFGPLPIAKTGNVFVRVLIDKFSRCVEAIALKRAEVSDVANALRDVRMPKRDVTAVRLSDNGYSLQQTSFAIFVRVLGLGKFEVLRTTH